MSLAPPLVAGSCSKPCKKDDSNSKPGSDIKLVFLRLFLCTHSVQNGTFTLGSCHTEIPPPPPQMMVVSPISLWDVISLQQQQLKVKVN